MSSSAAAPFSDSASVVERLVASHLGDVRAHAVCRSFELPEAPAGHLVTRGELALALAAILFDDVQRRVPMARAYVEDVVGSGQKVVLDHGALRTVAAPSGTLPAGADAFDRILVPLGYRRVGQYDLERIGMTGYAFQHEDEPEAIPQYFVSELHPERFSPEFQGAVARVLGTARDSLSPAAHVALAALAERRAVPFETARALLPELARCFDRHHDLPTVADYETLLAESAEMAWIATEGNAFNHATDRVEDVFEVADAQKALGRPMKDSVEVSANGNVMQTAFRAVTRQALFRGANGYTVVREVPGSFHEFITRKRLADGTLDLTFDAGNATSIFKMTSADRPKESA